MTRPLRVLALSALADVVIGLVMAAYARQQDSSALLVAGLCLAALGALVAVGVLIAADRPERR